MTNPGMEFRVGLFTLLGVVATVFAVFVLNPDLFRADDRVRFHTILKDASGILPKTHVKTNGVNIGKVVTVELDRNATRVEIEIRDDVRVPKGAKIEIRTVGFLGDKFIDIVRPDSEDLGLIAPGELIPRNEDSTDLNEVISLVGGIAQDIKKVTANLADVLGTEEGRDSIANIVENIEVFTKDARGILGENRENVKSLIAKLEKFSGSLNEVLDDENKEKIDRVLAAFDESMIEVKGATKNINLISEKIEKGEGTLGRLVNDEETLEELEGAIKDIREVISPINRLQVEVDYHGELRRDDSSQNYFNLNLRTRPNNYYVLGFTDVDVRTRDTTTETETVDGSTAVRTKESIKDEAALRFNLQFAQRWYWAGIRFGLFESTGGIAGDFWAFGDRFKLSLEAFDFADKDSEVRKGAHLKAYASVLFFNHIYAMVGVDDPTRLDPETGEKDPDTNYFGGIGVSFSDQDLKGLFGVASLAGP